MASNNDELQKKFNETKAKKHAATTHGTYNARWQAFVKHFEDYIDDSELGVDFGSIPENDILMFITAKSTWAKVFTTRT